ncbi:MAG: 2-hydroxypropyl-CoM lyase, partial [Gammaproteobacteria bacterium]|nr:2-hydroxypropyl-CoM lyase [Gammaproteobacteria bacterium]
MKIRNEEVLIPTSIVGNYPNPRWWDTLWATNFSGDQAPPDAKEREALEDAIATMAHDQEMAGLDIISDGRVQGDNY